MDLSLLCAEDICGRMHVIFTRYVTTTTSNTQLKLYIRSTSNGSSHAIVMEKRNKNVGFDLNFKEHAIFYFHSPIDVCNSNPFAVIVKWMSLMLIMMLIIITILSIIRKSVFNLSLIWPSCPFMGYSV